MIKKRLRINDSTSRDSYLNQKVQTKIKTLLKVNINHLKDLL